MGDGEGVIDRCVNGVRDAGVSGRKVSNGFCVNGSRVVTNVSERMNSKSTNCILFSIGEIVYMPVAP